MENEPILPREPDSEKALIGSIVLDPSMVDAVVLEVCGRDFFNPDFGKLFDALLILYEAGKGIDDPVVLMKELPAMAVPVEVRNAAFLTEIVRFVPTAQHALYYAQQIRNAAMLREIQSLSLELTRRTAEVGASPESLATWMDSKLQAIGSRQTTPVQRLDAIAREVLAEIDHPTASGTPILSGLACADHSMGGFVPGELIVLAARPGVGKTVFATQLALHCANRGRKALIISLEMFGTELITRILCGQSEVNSRIVRAKAVSQEERFKLGQSAERIGDAPFFVWSPPTATLSKIRAIARQQSAISPLSILIVDYLQLLRAESEERRLPRHEQVGLMSSGLKGLARELGIPVLCLAQLNREADGAEPKLSHLRESGSIEQDADGVLFLHPKLPAAGERPAITDLIIAKFRNGDTGKIELAWYPQQTLFGEPPNQEWEPN